MPKREVQTSKMRDHADIDAIRKKHEAWKALFLPRVHEVDASSNLSISDVDALFTSLDEAHRLAAKLTELVCECAPITWCRADCLDDAIRWEREAEKILTGGLDE